MPHKLYNIEDYVQHLMHNFSNIHASIREKLKATKAEMVIKQHKTAIPVKIKQGDTVVVQQPNHTSKLAAKSVSPNRIAPTSIEINLNPWTHIRKSLFWWNLNSYCRLQIPWSELMNLLLVRQSQVLIPTTYSQEFNVNFIQQMLLLHLAVFITWVRSLLTISPTHLKPGALTHHLGETSLIEEVLVVRYPYSPLLSTANTVQLVSDELAWISDSIKASRNRYNKDPGTRSPWYLSYSSRQTSSFAGQSGESNQRLFSQPYSY